jgi:hypothetical protein
MPYYRYGCLPRNNNVYEGDWMTSYKEFDVRDSLSKCLAKMESGLTFVKREAHIPPTIATKSFIDLLATDADGKYVVVEVKCTGPATREAIHEILKYIEAVKNHLGLQEHELRVIVACVEWRELILPFSSFVARTTCQVDGYSLEVDDLGAVSSVKKIKVIPIRSERVFAPWHELRFYHDLKGLEDGIASHEAACSAKLIESYVLIILGCPEGHPDGYPSTKQIANINTIKEMAVHMGVGTKDASVPLYKYAIYFALQQFSREEYIARLNVEDANVKEELKYLHELSDEGALCRLQEMMLDAKPSPSSDFFEIGYHSKFKSRLLEDEGWKIEKVLRYGAFDRNALLPDETIVNEVAGAKGNNKQSMNMLFHPSRKSEISEVRARIDLCLVDNEPWRKQLHFVLDEIGASNDSRQCKINVMNASSAIATVYLVATQGELYIPNYHIQIPESDGEVDALYFGCLVYNGGKARSFNKILDEFYGGEISQLLHPLLWGGYEERDVQIVRRLGLRYKTFKMVNSSKSRSWYMLENHEWETCKPVHPFNSYMEFLEKEGKFLSEVCDVYSSHWDGRRVILNRGE